MLLTMESKTAAYHKLETLIERGRATAIKQAGGIGEFHHDHESAPVDKQLVIRGNLDTLYSTGVWDLDAETADCHTAGRGQAFSFDDRHYGRSIRTRRLLQRWQIHLHSGKNRHTLPRTGLRTFFNQAILKISKQLMRCRIQRKTEQKAPGRFEVPNWDPVSQKKVRDALVVLYSTLPDQNHMFGTKEEVDPVRCLIGGAGGCVGNPEKDAKYLNTPPKNKGVTVYQLTTKDVPVGGFWSISVYNAQGLLSEERIQCLFT